VGRVWYTITDWREGYFALLRRNGKEFRMEESRSHIAEGVSLICIAIAYALHTLTIHKYYGPVLLLCVGVLQIAFSFLPEKAQRKIPVVGIITVALGVSLLIVVISGGRDVIMAALLSIIVAAIGVRMMFR
jgi:uncharacterized membrane protein HdeD (DUF308 family)